MEFVEHADDRPEPISIARCRELLGEEAESMTDQEIATDPPPRRDDGLHRGRDVPGAAAGFPSRNRASETHLARAREWI